LIVLEINAELSGYEQSLVAPGRIHGKIVKAEGDLLTDPALASLSPLFLRISNCSLDIRRWVITCMSGLRQRNLIAISMAR
jgi:hypothetical protein